ncbi:hypothetical protein [Paracoccus sp. MKU1]|uniref:hypothetical protein n=1 Tax=Paracoccus sp. MKU1 TaxID=1745182 RepID=UPI00128EF973|nr:hypothetical protein [Paracoccus sp. MKU1]
MPLSEASSGTAGPGLKGFRLDRACGAMGKARAARFDTNLVAKQEMRDRIVAVCSGMIGPGNHAPCRAKKWGMMRGSDFFHGIAHPRHGWRRQGV